MKFKQLGPDTKIYQIKSMKLLDKSAWEKFFSIYHQNMIRFANDCGVKEDEAEEIVSRVIHHLCLELPKCDTESIVPFRKYLSDLIRKEIQHYRYEKKRFFSLKLLTHIRGFPLMTTPPEYENFAERVGEDLSPRTIKIMKVVDHIKQRVNSETWETYHRVAVMEDQYANLAKEFGVKESTLRRRVFRVNHIIQQYLSSQK